MNLTRLRYFVVLAEELHFGRAADVLHMAQPALSQQIRLLEKETGADLFERTTRRVSLTHAGRTLYPRAAELLRDADELERLMAEHADGNAGILRIGFVDSSSYAVMPQFLRSYRERWPEVRFELHSMSSEAQSHALPNGQIDIGIARTKGDERLLSHTEILEEDLVVAVGADHELASQPRLRLADLAGESFISFSRTSSPALTSELRSMLEAEGAHYDPIIEAEEYTTIIGLVSAGEGIAVVPATVRSFQPTGVVYIPLVNKEATSRLFLLTRKDERLRVARHAIDLAHSVSIVKGHE